jgi:hypothetical protein
MLLDYLADLFVYDFSELQTKLLIYALMFFPFGSGRSLWLSCVTRGKLLRCANRVPRTSSTHNRKQDVADETNAHYCGSDCVGEQQEQRHVPHEL